MPDPSVRARLSLEGLSIGDAVGEQALRRRSSPTAGGPWPWTDDTALAVPIVEALDAAGFVTADDLARRYAAAWARAPHRGYGAGAAQLLAAVHAGAPWEAEAQALFGGGSYGNGAAMRVAPLGAWFAGAPARAAAQAATSARPTHAHPDGVAGAVAVAVAAATVADADDPVAWLDGVVAYAAGPVGARLHDAARHLHLSPEAAAARYGDGGRISAVDTVPFALWCVACHLADGPTGYEAAVDAGVAASVDKDTVGAIIGGVIVLRAGVAGLPALWRARREPLPPGVAWP